MDKHSFITSVGIDRGPQNTVNLSVQIPITQNALPSVIGGGNQSKKFYIVNLNAKTVHQAFGLLEARTDRSLTINQNKTIIIGEEAAHQDIQPVLDYLERTTQAPIQALVFVADGTRAEEVLKLEPVQNQLPGMMFLSAGQSISKYDRTYFIPLWQFHQKIIHGSKDTFAPLVKVDQIHRVYIISGLAVFNGNRMAGKLDWKESEVFGLLTGLEKSGLITFNLPNGQITLRNVSGKPQIKVRLQHGRPFFEVKIKVQGSTSELTNKKTVISHPEIIKYQRIIAREIQWRINDLIRKLQAYNSDVINFGEEFRVQHQNVWKKTGWKKSFPTVPFRVTVKVQIVSVGRFR